MNLLVVAARLGLAHSKDVCSILQLEGSTLSRNIERMRVKGWLEKVATEDGREHPFRLTKKGKALLEKAAPGWEAAQAKARKILGPQAEKALRNVADRLLEEASYE